jgi:redox-sensitive bicupin YhaK (pirin superfamily)
MSSLEADPVVGRDDQRSDLDTELLEGAPVALGGPRGLAVTRTLPHQRRRMVGAWCFLDAYGPHDLTGTAGMRIGPHPHIGLQTVSWLVTGELLHRDSLGSRREIRPGQLNLMTAGRGIAHSEESPADHGGVLHGVQLWVALPEADRAGPPAFAHHGDLPVCADGGLTATVLMGELAGSASPARCFSPLLGAEVALVAGTDARLPLRRDFEYAVLTLDGTAAVDGAELKPGPLRYLGRTSLRLGAGGAARVLLLGGEPSAEKLVMWWNFVGRTHEEIVAAREDWMARVDGMVPADGTASADGMAGRRFGPVEGYAGDPMPAPPMPITRLLPRGRVR